MRNQSLTRTLFSRVAPTILVTIILIGMMAFKSATRQIESAYDAQLISSANMMWLAVEEELQNTEISAFRRIRKIEFSFNDTSKVSSIANEYADDRMFRIWKNRRLIMLSDGALGTQVPLQPRGFSNVTYKKDRWRIYSQPIPETDFVIEAGEKIILRRSLVEQILIELATPLLLLIPLVGALIWYGIGTGLGTIRALMEQIRFRSPDDLSALTLSDMPRDLVPLGQSINQLLTKLRHSFTAEKRFAEHAAHHLRTPLAALKLQLQLLTHTTDEKARNALLTDLSAAMDRASQLVSQLLISTRVSHQAIVRVPLSWRAMIITLLEELAPLATQKNITLSFESTDDSTVMADETLLRLITGNILENAIKYTPAGGAVTVTLAGSETDMRYSVSDTGPGIPEAERALVFERFYRVGTSRIEGTGLGLAIVAESVARLSGTIVLAAAEGESGLKAEVILPKS